MLLSCRKVVALFAQLSIERSVAVVRIASVPGACGACLASIQSDQWQAVLLRGK